MLHISRLEPGKNTHPAQKRVPTRSLLPLKICPNVTLHPKVSPWVSPWVSLNLDSRLAGLRSHPVTTLSSLVVTLHSAFPPALALSRSLCTARHASLSAPSPPPCPLPLSPLPSFTSTHILYNTYSTSSLLTPHSSLTTNSTDGHSFFSPFFLLSSKQRSTTNNARCLLAAENQRHNQLLPSTT